MGRDINSKDSDYCARISLDGKYLFFSRRNLETHKINFYWVSSEIIERLKPEQLKNK